MKHSFMHTTDTTKGRLRSVTVTADNTSQNFEKKTIFLNHFFQVAVDKEADNLVGHSADAGAGRAPEPDRISTNGNIPSHHVIGPWRCRELMKGEGLLTAGAPETSCS